MYIYTLPLPYFTLQALEIFAKHYNRKLGWFSSCDWPHRHQAWQCVTLPHTHISRCSWSLFMLEIRCCDGRSGGIHLGLNGCPSMRASVKNRKEKRTVFFPSICILLSSRGTPLWLWAAPFLVQISETGYPLTQLLCLSSRPVSLGLHFGSGCCVHHSAIKGFHILLASNWGSVS